MDSATVQAATHKVFEIERTVTAMALELDSIELRTQEMHTVKKVRTRRLIPWTRLLARS